MERICDHLDVPGSGACSSAGRPAAALALTAASFRWVRHRLD